MRIGYKRFRPNKCCESNESKSKNQTQTQNYKIDSKISKDRLHHKNLQNLIKRVDSASRAYYAAERAAKNFEIEKDLADQIFKESLNNNRAIRKFFYVIF